ncbi:WD repeat-containing protein 11-like [Antedon mediterranea]|uniref:WD repeat-containing protein 11-like n=1 Tax=Antedon mediterranea TaxID=105859 RepID=UPI003AF9DC3B
MNVVPKTIGGILHNLNKNASDWGWPSLLAYGCQTSVVVVDTKTVQIIQTLEKHKSHVTRVKWARENYHHTIEAPYTLRLASADNSGHIIVWDVSEACERSSFSEGNKPVLEMEWLSTQDASHDLLVALHPPYSIILWNVATGTKLWKKTFTDNILSMTFDPFEPTNLTLLGNDCILFVNDFSIAKAPSSNGRKFYITCPSSIPSSSGSNSASTGEKKNGGKPKGALRRVRLLVGDSKPKSSDNGSSDTDPISLNDCIQLCYLQSCRHHLLLLYTREILILDLEINQTVGTIPMERTGSPFQMVYPCRQRDVLVCMHENGSISVRVRRNGQSSNHPTSAVTPIDQLGSFSNFQGEAGTGFDQLEIIYDLRCQSDPLRVTKHVRAFSIAVCLCTERSIALVMSDGRILFWNLITIDYIPSTISNTHSQLVLTPLFSPGYSSDSNGEFEFLPPIKSPQKSQVAAPYPKLCLSDLIGHAQNLGNETKHGHEVILKFVLTGLLSGVGIMPTVIRMCPPLTTKNLTYHQPLVAVGTATGLVQVFNVSSGALVKEYNIHISNIRGIEWINLNSFFSFSHPNPNNNGLVRNELLLLDLQTGRTTPLRKEKGEESPIEAVKVSHLKLYFIIMFKEKAFEVWDLKSCTMLREMPTNFPIITALEWSPSHNVKNLKKRQQQQALHESISGNLPVKETTPTASHILDTVGVHAGTKATSTSISREHFVFTDNNGLLYHFIVQGSTVKDGSKMPPESGMGSVTCIAWKQDLMVLGDTEGNLNLWDIKGKISRNVPTHRGWLKKLKFAPGKGNMRLMILWNDGVDIWDTNAITRISGLRGNKESFKVLDSDWASSDKPVVLTEDGCLRVYDVEFKATCTSLSHSVLPEPVFCPHLLTAKAGLAMKYTIQHQAWNDSYTLELSSEYETPEDENIIELVNVQMNLLPMEIQSYLSACPYGTAQRCLFAANLFGDEAEMNFWTVALYYLKSEQARLGCIIHKNSTELAATPSTSDIYLPGDPLDPMHIAGGSDLLNLIDKKEEAIKCTCLKEPSLDCCYDALCTNQSYKRYQLERLCLHDNKRATYAHTKKCAESLMLLGQTDRAVQLFLETESENDSYYVDLLRACLVATIRSSGASQSTIKLVATSLIANGRLSEGVQLLCLIDKGLDACRYLQTYGQWNQAVWLAKATLSYAECCEVLKRWVDYLCTPTVNQKSLAILVLLSMGQFRRVLELLMSLHYYDRAAMLAEACSEFGVLPEDKVTRSILEKIYIEYARYLLSLGNKKGYGYFCNKAAEKAKKVITDLEWS